MSVLGLTLIAIFGVVIIAGFSMVMAGEAPTGSGRELVFSITALFGTVASLGLFIAYALLCGSYYAAGVKAEVINKEYGTDYTQEQVFFADEVIDVIHEIKRKRVDLRIEQSEEGGQ